MQNIFKNLLTSYPNLSVIHPKTNTTPLTNCHLPNKPIDTLAHQSIDKLAH